MSTRMKQALAILAGVVIAVVMMLLGLWQMSSYEASTRDTSAERAAEAPTSLAQSVSDDGVVQDIYGKRVTFEGSYLPGHQVTVGEKDPLRVLTAFEMIDGRYIAVVRGALTSSDVELGIPAAPSGPQSVTGIFLAPDMPATSSPQVADLATVRVQELAQAWPSPLIAGYVTLSAEDSRAQGLDEAFLVLPAMEGSPTHRGYALQWWVFAAGAIAFGAYTAHQIGKDAKKKATKAQA
ncbi:MAG: SURF1 family protein [Propionibacteriaceae bacterium]|nr:SURF1 family protein [Propionibacteriaceae bacterium]